MSRDPLLKATRNRTVKEAYRKLESETVNGLNGKKEQKYRHTAILAILSRKFFLATETIEKIVQLPDEAEQTDQLNLFNEE